MQRNRSLEVWTERKLCTMHCVFVFCEWICEVPRAFETIGTISHFNLHEPSLPYKNLIFEFRTTPMTPWRPNNTIDAKWRHRNLLTLYVYSSNALWHGLRVFSAAGNELWFALDWERSRHKRLETDNAIPRPTAGNQYPPRNCRCIHKHAE